MKKIERIDNLINYGKLAMVALIILFGADPTPRGLLILSLAALLIIQVELVLVLYKQYIIEEREIYLDNLIQTIKAVEKENEKNRAA